MSSYQNLNKELIGQVQTMRMEINMYCNEIVNLKKEAMEKHETEVMLRRECCTWALESFTQLIKIVQPDSDILHVLKEYCQSQDRISNATSSLRASRTPRRHSVQLTAEFRRSNSILNSRKSLCTISPIRRRSNEATEEDPAETEVDSLCEEQEPQGDEEDCENVAESVEKQTEFPQERTEENLDIIFEDCEIDIEEDDKHDDEEDNETDDESVEEVTVDDISISKTNFTLNDVTNTLADITNSSYQKNYSIKVVRKRGRLNKSKTKRIDQKDSTDDFNNDSDMENRGPLAVTLQEPRRHTNARHASMTNKSIPITQAFNNTCKDGTIDMTLANFKDAASSTPNSRRNSLHKPESPSTFTTTTNNLTSETEPVNSLTSRPSRQCKPKDLAEPKLGTKLRNESNLESICKKTKSRSRSRTKQKT